MWWTPGGFDRRRYRERRGSYERKPVRSLQDYESFEAYLLRKERQGSGLFRNEVLCLFKGLERKTAKGFGNMKVVCIKDTVTKYSSRGNPYESRDPFLLIGRVYTSIADGAGVILFENEEGDTW